MGLTVSRENPQNVNVNRQKWKKLTVNPQSYLKVMVDGGDAWRGGGGGEGVKRF